MRSLLALALALVGFAYFTAEPHRRAEDILRAEEEALAELRARGRAPAPQPVEIAAGYEFRWDEAGVLVARPVDRGVRWFATTDGEQIYEFDPSLFQTGSAGAPTEAMVRYLALRSDDRTLSSRPPGWKRTR